MKKIKVDFETIELLEVVTNKFSQTKSKSKLDKCIILNFKKCNKILRMISKPNKYELDVIQ